MHTRHDDLARHPFLEGFGQKHLKLLATCAMPVDFASNDVFYREGDPANRFYLIEKGDVALELEVVDQAPILIQTIGAGGTVGWSWMVHPYQAQLTARTLTPVKAIFFYGSRLLEECENDHELGYELMRRVMAVAAGRLESAIRRLAICGGGTPVRNQALDTAAERS